MAPKGKIKLLEEFQKDYKGTPEFKKVLSKGSKRINK